MTFRSCCPFISRKKIISDVYCATDEDDIKGIYDGDEASEAYYSGKIKSLALDEASSYRGKRDHRKNSSWSFFRFSKEENHD